MNNIVEKWLFGFSKVHLTGEVYQFSHLGYCKPINISTATTTVSFLVMVIRTHNVQCGMLVIVLALKIHMSKNAYDALKAFPAFIAECRDNISEKVVNLCNLNSCFLTNYALKSTWKITDSGLKSHLFAHDDVVWRWYEQHNQLRTDNHTNTKNSNFFTTYKRAQFDLYQTRHGDAGDPYHLYSSITFS